MKRNSSPKRRASCPLSLPDCGRITNDFPVLVSNSQTASPTARARSPNAIKLSGKNRTGDCADALAILFTWADPHTLNAFRHDYAGLPPSAHITEILAEAIVSRGIEFKPDHSGKLHVFHDPCYLGRHNGIYEAPRSILRSIPGLKFGQMRKQCDRSFCCGGPLSFFHQPKENVRMADMRIQQVLETHADVVVTACPWCLVNLTEAAKSAGSSIEVIDITELALRQLRD